MKTTKILVLGMAICTFLLSFVIQAQEAPKPVFITVTTMYSNPDSDGKDWEATEQEYFDKVTSKNDLILSSEILTHYYTENSSEVLFVSVFKTWGDIEKSNEMTNDLIKKGWPDEKERDAFFAKQSSYYTKMHSDEIYSSIAGGAKEYKANSKEPIIVYVRKSQMSLNGQGKGMKEYNEKITKNNPYIKGYYPSRHTWGADSRDFIEAYYYESLSDLEKSAEKNRELAKVTWPKDEDRKAFFDEMNKAFTGIHGDYLYRNVPTLSK
jgi:hypothetical protein